MTIYRVASRVAGSTLRFAPVRPDDLFRSPEAAEERLVKIVSLHDSLVRCFPQTYAELEYRIESATPAWEAA